MSGKAIEISFIVPLYNESASFSHLIERLDSITKKSPKKIEIILIDDGSTDNTAALMSSAALSDDKYQCIFLSRNFGHQMALSSGLMYVNASEAVMIIDGDLQDPPEMFFDFYEKYQNGYDVVYGIRKKRKEVFFKRISYFLFYRLLKKISYINIQVDSGDFSLISRKVVNILNKMPEESRFIRGMRSWIGFKQIGVEYERQKRFAGQPGYDLKMLIKLAYNGIFNFSEYPIKFVMSLGVISVGLSCVYFLFAVIRKFFLNDVPLGFTGLLAIIILFGGLQLISISVIGEYVLRIFFQVKKRPLFIVKNRIADKELLDDNTDYIQP